MKLIWSILCVAIFILMFNLEGYTVKSATNDDSNENVAILVDTNEERLYLIDKKNNIILKKYLIASGKFETPSPIGTWKVTRMAKWSGGFGTRWIGLNVGWGKFGIHGTDKPYSIGSDSSHGCIRMYNKDIEDLYEHVECGMTVTIYAGPNGPFENGLYTLKPGDRGTDVLVVQRKMKDIGYYQGELDGIYGEGMKQYVLKFRKDNNLSDSHNIDYDFYSKIGISVVD